LVLISVTIQVLIYRTIQQDHMRARAHARSKYAQRICVEYQEKTVIFGERNLKIAAVSRFKVYLGTLVFPRRNFRKTVKIFKLASSMGLVEVRDREISKI
jgi:hypothetical protein